MLVSVIVLVTIIVILILTIIFILYKNHQYSRAKAGQGGSDNLDSARYDLSVKYFQFKIIKYFQVSSLHSQRYLELPGQRSG